MINMNRADVVPVLQCTVIGISAGDRMEIVKRTALRAFSSSGLKNVSSLGLVFLPLQKTLGHGTLRLEPSTCPGEGQDLAEPETLEAEAAPTSKVATRAARPPTTYSKLEILFVMPLIVRVTRYCFRIC